MSEPHSGRRTSLRIVSIGAMLLLSLAAYGCAPLGMFASTPTPATGAIPADSAILGGTEEAFTQKYGAPTTMQGIYHITTSSGTALTLVAGTARIFSGPFQGQIRIRLVFLSSDAQTTQQEIEALYPAFLPVDSVALGSDNPTTGGTRYLYRSAALATIFTESGILDASRQVEPPGTFEVLCGRGLWGTTDDAKSLFGCLIQA